MAKKRVKRSTKKRTNPRFYPKSLAREKRRSKRSRAIDESKTSKIVHRDYRISWSKNPNKSDVLGIDTKKAKAKTHNEVITYIKSVIPNTKKEGKSLISVSKSMLNKQKRIQELVNIRYGNIKIKKRKKKNTPNDYRITFK